MIETPHYLFRVGQNIQCPIKFSMKNETGLKSKNGVPLIVHCTLNTALIVENFAPRNSPKHLSFASLLRRVSFPWQQKH